MNAREARIIAENRINPQLEKILEEIKKVAAEGKFQVQIYESTDVKVRKSLENKGYSIGSPSLGVSARDGECITITW